MRSNRSISLPLAFAATCCLWFAFLWTMQHAPAGHRPSNSGNFTGSRSTGGLANPFASAVVKFFDDRDPRELSEDAPSAEPVFDAEMVEYLPMPKVDRAALAKDLPEVFADPSLTPRNLFRSDVDLDGDRDLDLALLVRLSKTTALGAVLEYLGDEKFRLAGRFYCRYERAEEFSKCFTVVLTGAGTMHILSRTSDLAWRGPALKAAPAMTGRTPETPPVAGWRWMRLEKGALASYGHIAIPPCAPVSLNRAPTNAESNVEPVPGVAEDLIRFVSFCGGARSCAVYRADTATKKADPIADPPAEFCAP